MSAIPEEAMPVVKMLRRDVRRPKKLPIMKGNSLRWENGCCAMGLHPAATAPCPGWICDFLEPVKSEITSVSIEGFYNWFDAQWDAQATVDAIWPREEDSP